MTNAEVARLSVELNLTGNFTSALGTAESALSRFSGVGGRISTVASKVGGALGHAAGQIKNLITGPLGLIGLTGGLLTFGGAISATLGKLNDLAFGTEKLVALTGGSAQSLSVLIAASEKYGIGLDALTSSAAFYEKNVDKVIKKNADLAKSLTDANGKALPFDQALLAIADIYAKSPDKAAAAAAAASLLGRGYATLVPILALGKQGIVDLETEAAKMGLQLNSSNIADFAKYREAIRGSQEAISGLEVAIGEDLLPTITDLANGLRSFVTDHKTDIVSFFHNAVQVGKDAAKVIGGFASAVLGFWNTIPPGLRDLFVKGFVADRTVKFLFGFDPVKSLGSAIFGGGIGGFLQRGSSPANPVFVSGTGLGGPGGPLQSIFDTLVYGLKIALAPAAIAYASSGADINDLLNPTQKKTVDQQQALVNRLPAPFGFNPFGTPQLISGGGTFLERIAPRPAGLSFGAQQDLERTDMILRSGFQSETASIVNALHLATGTLADRLKHPVVNNYVTDWLRAALRIANSTETTAAKLKDLQAIKDKLDEGKHATVHYLNSLIDAEKRKKTQFTFNQNIRIVGQERYRISTTSSTGFATNATFARAGVIS